MKMFVLVRKDLPQIQQAVQSAHALGEYLKKFPGTPWANGPLVLMGVTDSGALHGCVTAVEDAFIEHAVFYEPDVKGHTAVAFMLDKQVPTHSRFKRTFLDRHAKLLQFSS